ncbi:MAG: hydrogenase maturation nickel metallochaperone HypA [Deltaproteobacteria bacterium]|nr:MAG: hydrogenase maturation nickel metallochaperone HypA [Deltaproteobacteria bacterium]
MHELAIAQSLLKIVEEEALPYQGAKVTRVKLLIGRLSGVVPDALKFAFEVISQGGVAEGASLEIQEVPVRLRCHQCGEVFVVDNPFLTCPHCEGTGVEMVSGRELEITGMEIEDGNQGGQEHP